MPRAWTPPRHWPVRDAAQYKPLDWFIPFEGNARTHPQSQIDLLAVLLHEHGPDQPIVVDEGRVILKGHGRLTGARQGGLSHFTFIQRSGMSPAEKDAMRFQDNQVSLLSGWDKALATVGMASLKLAGYDMTKLGFPEAQLRVWGIAAGSDAAVDPEQAPEPSATPVVMLGDLWTLGNHRLICGDSTDAATVARLLGSDRPNLMVTDPPYGVNYRPQWRNERVRSNGSATDGRAVGIVSNDDQPDWTPAWDLFKGNVAYVWHSDRYSSVVVESLARAELICRAQIIWNKSRFVISQGDYHWKHEPCWYVVRKGKTGNWQGDRSQTTVWDISHSASETGHGTQKPIACMQKPMENNSSAGGLVYDPFCGSGTTIIAAELTGRKALCVELDPAYVQVAIERWQRVTGNLATCGGRTLDQIRANAASSPRRRGRQSRSAARVGA